MLFKKESISSEQEFPIVNINSTIKIPRFSSEDNFKTRKFIEVYNSVVTSNDWREEPFHSSFVNILNWIESNSFKIVILEDKKLVVNMRLSNSKNSTFHVRQAVDFHEVVTKMIMKICNYNRKIKPNKDGKLLILVTIIFSLDKVQYLDFTCNEIIDYFFDNYSKEEIILTLDYYIYDLEDIFNEIMINAKKESATSDTNKVNSTYQENIELLSQNRLFKLIYI